MKNKAMIPIMIIPAIVAVIVESVDYLAVKSGLNKGIQKIGELLENNPRLKTAKNWFWHHYDDEYQIDIYNMIREKIKKFISIPYLAVDHFEVSNFYATEDHILDLSKTWPKYRGNINHYTVEGNQIVYKQIVDKLAKIC